ncbi:MAG: DUF2937 family protein [Gallionella sp.]
MSIIFRYLIVIIACASLLAGLQVPNFADQYQKRVDAHLREVAINLQPFQDIANKFFGGDMAMLIDLNRKSEAEPLRAEGAAIEKMAERKQRFEAEMAALQTDMATKAIHILLHGDSEILEETRAQYSYNIPLDQEALVFGVSTVAVLLIAAELLFALMGLAFTRLTPILKRAMHRTLE